MVLGVPRTRGDEPYADDEQSEGDLRSPHARGAITLNPLVDAAMNKVDSLVNAADLRFISRSEREKYKGHTLKAYLQTKAEALL
jgi:hypothetical protein